jgi:hypothetical protein
MFQEPSLAIDASTVTGQRTVRADHSMTGHDNANGIRTVCQSHGSHRLRYANLPGQLSVADRFSARDVPESAPHGTLKRGTGRFYRQIIERGKVACKIPLDSVRVRTLSRFKLEPVCAVLAPQQKQYARFMICPINRAKVSVVVSNDQHLANRRVDPVDD